MSYPAVVPRGCCIDRLRQLIPLLAAGLFAAGHTASAQPADPVGWFDSHGDIGITPAPGKAMFDAVRQTYTVTGGGNNIWAKVDAGHFVWRKLSGDFTFAADITFLDNPTGTPDVHRKACLMVRQNLDADAAYVDAALHGNGLAALQFRDAKGEATREVQSNVIGPMRVRIEKHGDMITLFVGQAGEEPRFTGAAHSLKFSEPFYLGFAVGAHNQNDTSPNLESVAFSHVELKTDLPATTPKLYSAIETQASNPVNATQTQNTDRTVLYLSDTAMEGPLWLPDNSGVIFSSGGHLLRLPIKLPPGAAGRRGGRGGAATPAPILGNAPTAAGAPTLIDTGGLTHISRMHGLSSDGAQIIFVDHPPGQPRPPANTYLVPLAGGTPRLLTPNTGAGSSLSPDGKTFVFDTDTVADIYTIPTDGSAPATRLTNGMGKNYGPQFSHDGSFIIFCSDRSGTMQVWRMKPDGSEPVQLTVDDNNNWFPHLAPNDAAMLFVTYPKGIVDDPANQPVEIRRLNLTSHANDLMARILGGPAASPSWSPGGGTSQIIFVSEQWVY